MRIRAFLVIAIAAVLISIPALASPVRERISLLLSPVITTLSGIRYQITDTTRSLWQLGELRNERSELQAEILRLQTELNEREAILQENEALRRELAIPPRDTTFSRQTATTILVGTNPLDRAIIIDAGIREGIRVGHPVLREGFLIGRVVSVAEETSVVRLITSTKSRIQAWIPELNARGLVVGNGIGAELTEISSSISVPMGSLVSTSGLSLSGSQTVPANIPFGSTQQASTSERGGAQRFSLDLSIDPSKAATVVVLLTAVESDLP